MPRRSTSKTASETEHCCRPMTAQANWECAQHGSVFDCADAVVRYDTESREYGLIIHDGGTSYLSITFCPWCGQRLPKPRRRWTFGRT
ncbi:DUF6980 family protein [Saccharomonospora iraqiensis]|uniref:DUF6980 family protein n=1 Tax=Saccharomonospora iraqiensis TaxID=52698 RepID=UPI000A073585